MNKANIILGKTRIDKTAILNVARQSQITRQSPKAAASDVLIGCWTDEIHQDRDRYVDCGSGDAFIMSCIEKLSVQDPSNELS